jgi:deoxyribodipyrimidine photolyase
MQGGARSRLCGFKIFTPCGARLRLAVNEQGARRSGRLCRRAPRWCGAECGGDAGGLLTPDPSRAAVLICRCCRPRGPMAKARVAAATLLGAAALAALVFLLQNRRSRRVSVLWLRSALRVRDNEALQLASEAGTDGLLILYIWRFGRVPKTPAQVFECAAVEALQRELAARGNRLQIHACIGDDEQAVVVAQAAAAADASTIIVDASGLDGDAVPPGLEAALAAAGCRARVQVVAKHSLLLPMYRSEHATGRTKNGSKQLRWANWLVAASANKIEPPLPSPRRLPPPPSPMLTGSTSILPDPTSAGEWAKRVLSLWGEVSEEEAVCRAKAVAATGSERAMRLGETARALDSLDADGGDSNAGLAVPSRLSPYLRFGVISPREAYHLGVRKRHLLWRDWSHLCWRYSESLRHGVAVVAVLDGCTRRKQASAEASTRASTQASTQASPEVIPPPPRAASVPPAASLPPAVSVHVLRPEWATDDEAAFAAWATGTTGAPVVDAAMRQLWATGWMTRRARLLCASCLVEGMGGDWRAGRDWCASCFLRSNCKGCDGRGSDGCCGCMACSRYWPGLDPLSHRCDPAPQVRAHAD